SFLGSDRCRRRARDSEPPVVSSELCLRCKRHNNPAHGCARGYAPLLRVDDSYGWCSLGTPDVHPTRLAFICPLARDRSGDRRHYDVRNRLGLWSFSSDFPLAGIRFAVNAIQKQKYRWAGTNLSKVSFAIADVDPRIRLLHKTNGGLVSAR